MIHWGWLILAVGASFLVGAALMHWYYGLKLKFLEEGLEKAHKAIGTLQDKIYGESL